MPFQAANQPEIIRSQQKDDYYLSQLKNNMTELVQKVFGVPVWIKYQREIFLIADLIYYHLTTSSGLQTLGEEYVNIVQVDSSKRRIPSKWRREEMIFCHVLGPYVVDKFLLHLEKQIQSHPGWFTPTTTDSLLKIIPVVRKAISFLYRCHMTVFYLQGVYQHISKRFSHIQYIRARDNLQPKVLFGYRMLGWLSSFQLAFSIGKLIYSFYQLRKEGRGFFQELTAKRKNSSHTLDIVLIRDKCCLCLEKRHNSTVTPCGHLFCWQCIFNWVLTKPECPLCREKFQISRLVCLQNYDEPIIIKHSLFL